MQPLEEPAVSESPDPRSPLFHEESESLHRRDVLAEPLPGGPLYPTDYYLGPKTPCPEERELWREYARLWVAAVSQGVIEEKILKKDMAFILKKRLELEDFYGLEIEGLRLGCPEPEGVRMVQALLFQAQGLLYLGNLYLERIEEEIVCTDYRFATLEPQEPPPYAPERRRFGAD